MRKALFLCILLVGVVVLAGCGGSSSTGSVVGVLWQWNGLHETHPASLSAVPDPENYLLLLNDDGSFSAKADCNQLAGTYSLSGSSLELAPGPMTKAHCGEHSQSDQYVALLHQVATQSEANGELTLGLGNDAGELFFHAG